MWLAHIMQKHRFDFIFQIYAIKTWFFFFMFGYTSSMLVRRRLASRGLNILKRSSRYILCILSTLLTILISSIPISSVSICLLQMFQLIWLEKRDQNQMHHKKIVSLSHNSLLSPDYMKFSVYEPHQHALQCDCHTAPAKSFVYLQEFHEILKLLWDVEKFFALCYRASTNLVTITTVTKITALIIYALPMVLGTTYNML